MRFLTFLLALVCLAACKPLLKMTGNYREPQYESREDIKQYVKEEQGTYHGLYTPSSPASLVYLTDSVNNAIPFVMVLDKNRKRIFIDKKCPWKNVAELDSLAASQKWSEDTSFHFANMANQLTCIDGSSALTDSKNHDYYVFYFWSKFVPKLSKEMIREVSAINKTHSNNIYIGSINLDLQKGWEAANKTAAPTN